MNRNLFLFSALLMMTCNLRAQCAPDPIQANSINGYLLFGYKGNFSILDGVEVQISDDYDNRLVARVSVAPDGHFSIKGIKPGRYIIKGSAPQMIYSEVQIDIKKHKKSSLSKDSMILIILAADARYECGGTSITIESKSKIDKILNSLENGPASDKKSSPNQAPL